jgi:3-phosphoshikimate 1-carboxyvinyltransferase
MSSASIPAGPLTAERSPWLRGPISLPGDPVLSALALMLAAMARGESVIDNASVAPMVGTTATVLTALGAHLDLKGRRWHVQGIGTGGFLEPAAPIDLSQAGPVAPLFLGLLGGHDFPTEIAGLAAEPANEALLGFIARGGGVAEREAGRVRIRGPRFSIPLDIGLSAEAHGLIGPLLLQALVTTGRSSLHLPDGLHDPAEDLLAAFGARIGAERDGEITRVMVEGMAPLRAQALTVPGDPALAAYPAVAAMIAPDSEITVNSVALNRHGLGLLDALALLGGDIGIGEVIRGGAPIVVRHAPLSGVTLPESLGIAAEDFPIVCIAAAFAEGETVIEGLGEGVRRLALTRALRANGVECVEQRGGLMIRGRKRNPGGGNVTPRLDPKLAMAFLVLGMATDQPVTIDDGAVMADLFPGFADAFEHVGASFAAGNLA